MFWNSFLWLGKTRLRLKATLDRLGDIALESQAEDAATARARDAAREPRHATMRAEVAHTLKEVQGYQEQSARFTAEQLNLL